MPRPKNLLALLLLAGSLCVPAFAASPADSADELFKAGKFAEAGKLYGQIVDRDSKNAHALQQLGYIALLSNQLADAQKWLHKAIAVNPDNAEAQFMLAEVFYRQNDYPKAVAALKAAGPNHGDLEANYPMLVLGKLEAFQKSKPYRLHGRGDVTALNFVQSELLPVVNVRINGSADVTFFIDTGGPELLLDSDFARELGVKPLASQTGTFSGGQQSKVETGKIDSLTMGDWTLYDVPVAMMPLRQMSASFGVKHLDGCIGTNVLYQFLATLDFPHKQLTLRKKREATLKAFRKEAADDKAITVPIWMAGDHFVMGWGQINEAPPALLFVDTGLAGAGVKLGGQMLKAADIKLDESKATTGEGGGGNLKIVPYTVAKASFGDAKEENVPGLYDGPFPWENSFGFYLAGMLGHDFYQPYAVTLDFDAMRVYLEK